MGYESRFYVVEKSIIETDDLSMKYATKIAMFDMCKVPDIVGMIKKSYKPTDVYIYADDGNTKIIKDAYEEPLIEIPIEDMISIMRKAIDKDGDYRRLRPFLHLLLGFDLTQWNNLVVLHYGY